MPDYVSGIVLILVFGIWLGWLPVTAQWPDGAGALTQIKYLLLPAMTLERRPASGTSPASRGPA